MQINRAIVWSLHPLSCLCLNSPYLQTEYLLTDFFFFPNMQPNTPCHIVFLPSNINNVHLTVNALV